MGHSRLFAPAVSRYGRLGRVRRGVVQVWSTIGRRNPVLAWLDGKTWNDPEVSEVTWSYRVRDGRLVAGRTVAGQTETLPLDFGFGSGTHGVTFVALQSGTEPGLDPPGIEHRLSY